jgi:hypothetical protein
MGFRRAPFGANKARNATEETAAPQCGAAACLSDAIATPECATGTAKGNARRSGHFRIIHLPECAPAIPAFRPSMDIISASDD